MPPTLEISRARFLQNIAAVQARIAPSTLMLAMKDDAYGHGVDWAVDAAIAAAEPVTSFGGYDVPTALRIRQRAADASVFAWVTSADAEIAAALEARIDLGVGTAEYLRRVIDTARAMGRVARVHLKIDTGLHRNGIRPEDWSAVVSEAMSAQRAGLIRLAGVWSHLAEASDAEDDQSAEEFRTAVAIVRDAGGDPEAVHLTASAASWWRPELRGSVCRIGAFCYGIRSAHGPQIPGVLPAATLRASVVDVRGGEAVLGIGALHGLPSSLTGAFVGTPRGARALNRIDAATSVVGDGAGLRIGDAVSIFGPGAQGEGDATSLAERIDTVGEEIVTRLTAEVERVERP